MFFRGYKIINRLLTTDRRRGIAALFDQAICSATTLATFVVMARTCESEAVGAFALALSLLLPLRIFQDRVIATPYMMRFKLAADRAPTILGSALVHQVVLSLLAAVLAAIAGSVFYTLRGWDDLTQSTVAMILVAPCILWRDLLRAISFAHLQTSEAVRTDAIVGIVQTLALGCLYFSWSISAAPVLVAAGLANAIGVAAWFGKNRRSFSINMKESISEWTQSWVIARWLVAARVFGSAGTIVVPWIVVYVKGDAAAGIFATCLNLISLSFMFSRGLNNFFRPKAIHAFQEGGSKQLRNSLSMMAFVFVVYMAIASLVLAIAGDRLLNLIYGAEYSTFGMLACLLSLASLATSLSMVGDNGAMALHRPDLAFYAEVANGIVTVGLSFIAIHRFGLHGVAIAMLLGQLTGAMILAIGVVRLTGGPPRDAFGSLGVASDP